MKRIYIVDDSPEVRKRLAAMLSEVAAVRVVGQSGSAENALASIQRLMPDTVILDIRMPGKNGIQLLREIKSEHPGITAIMLTNYDYPQYRKESLQAGADHFFNKTREFERVVDLLRTELDARPDRSLPDPD
jgi:DNA-binding NarL/FixJ family response regulator